MAVGTSQIFALSGIRDIHIPVYIHTSLCIDPYMCTHTNAHIHAYTKACIHEYMDSPPSDDLVTS